MNNLKKIIGLLLTISLILAPTQYSTAGYAELDKNKLAPDSRVNKYAGKNKLLIDTNKFIDAFSKLRQVILDENGFDDQILSAIQEQNQTTLQGTGIEIEGGVYHRTIKGSKIKVEVVYLNVQFPKREGKGKNTHQVYFIKNHKELDNIAMKKLRITKPEDIKYFNQSPLAGVWISNKVPASSFESSHSGRNRRVASFTLFSLAAMFAGCTFDVKWPPTVTILDTGQDVVDVVGEGPDVYEPESIIRDADIQPPDVFDQPPQNSDITIEVEGLYTNNPNITLILEAKGAKEMIISEKKDFSDAEWQPYKPQIDFKLSEPDGLKTVYAKFGNEFGETEVVSDVVVLDTTDPQIEITSPIDGYVTSEPTIVVTGTYIEEYLESITVNEKPATLVNGTFTAEINLQEGDNIITIKATDKAGNSTIETIKVKYEPIIPPQNPSISIEEGLYTNNTIINLTLSVGGALEMIISENPDFSDADWEPYSTTKEFQLSPGDGEKTIYVKFRNSKGESTVVSDNITLDTTDPQVEIISPIDDYVTSESKIVVTGKYTEDNLESITVNGTPAALVNGTFSGDVILQWGKNTIKITITDKAENSKEKIIIVYYIYGVNPLDTPLTPDHISTPYGLITEGGVTPIIETTQPDILKISFQMPPGSGEYTGVKFTPYTVENVAHMSYGTLAIASTYFQFGDPPDQYAPWKAIDGIKGIWKSGEWASHLEEKPWIIFTFPSPQKIKEFRIYDRNVPPDVIPQSHIKKALLTTNNGTSLEIGTLPYDGTAYILKLPQEETGVKWVKIQVLEADGYNIGLSEFESISDIPHSNLIAEGLTTLEFNARGTNPFILKLIDGSGEELEVLITGLSPTDFKGYSIDLLSIIEQTGSLFDLTNVKEYKILIPASIIQEEGGWIEIQGLWKAEPSTALGTRGEYAHDPDLTEEEAAILEDQLRYAEMVPLSPVDEYNVFGITSWPGVLTPDSLNFQIGSHRFSAFHIGNNIYIPYKDMIMDKIQIYKEDIEKALDRRNKIILRHEVHEIKTGDHKYATLTEFEDNIDGLNYADIVTILLSVIINNKIDEIDDNFHELFIAQLLIHGMPLSPGTYSKILSKTLNISISNQTFEDIISTFKGNITTLVGENRIYTEDIKVGIDEKEIQDEPGYKEFAEAVQTQSKQGTIPVDLDRFLVINDTLSNAVTVDTEYFRRFIYFAKKLNPDISLTGITSGDKEDIPIAQLLGLIRQHIPNFQILDHIDFENYQNSLQNLGINLRNTVSILSNKSAKKIKDPRELKIIAPSDVGYNKVATIWQEFRVAVEGLDKGNDDFTKLVIRIAEELLRNLIKEKQITEAEAERLIAEINSTGIGFIPVYPDPLQYYRSIERMKSLLIAA